MTIELLDFKELDYYPAGSGIEFYDDKIYLVGDAAVDLLVMTKKWKKPQRIALFDATQQGLAAAIKPELEAMTQLTIDKKPHLLVIGSGAGASQSRAVLLNLKTAAPAF